MARRPEIIPLKKRESEGNILVKIASSQVRTVALTGAVYGGTVTVAEEEEEQVYQRVNEGSPCPPNRAWRRRLKSLWLPVWRWLVVQCAPLKCWETKEEPGIGPWREIPIRGSGEEFASNRIRCDQPVACSHTTHALSILVVWSGD